MEQVDKILKMYDAGNSIRDINKLIGMNRGKISRILKDNNRKTSFGASQYEILQCFNSGKNVKEISKLYKITEKRVVRILNINGIFFYISPILTDNDKTFILDEYRNGKSIKHISEMFSCSNVTIQKTLNELINSEESLATISHLKNRILPFKDNEILAFYKDGKTAKELAEMCGSSINRIKKIIKKSGFEMRLKNTKYTVDDSYLDNINTCEKAYFLGFFYGDGYHNLKKKELIISIQTKDRIVLDYFINDMNITRPLRTYQPKEENWQEKTILSFCSSKMSDMLTSFGCTPNKTKELNFPNFIPEEFIPSFILGIFDADGYIANKNGKGLNFSICGTFDICDGILKFFESKGIKTYIYRHKCGIYYVKASKLETLKNIYDLLYGKCKICLPRKKDIFDTISKLYLDKSRVKYSSLYQ